MEQDATAIEAHLHGAVVKGQYRPLQPTGRFIDELNRSDLQFDLYDVSVRLLGTDARYTYPRMTIAKNSLIAAVPSTAESRSLTAGINTMMTARARTRVHVSLVFDQVTVEGIAHVAFGAGPVAMHDFPRFFAVTDAQFSEVDGTNRHVDTVLVNRNALVGLVAEKMSVNSTQVA